MRAQLAILVCRSTLLASLVAVEYEKPLETFQDLLDNNVLMTLTRGERGCLGEKSKQIKLLFP